MTNELISLWLSPKARREIKFLCEIYGEKDTQKAVLRAIESAAENARRNNEVPQYVAAKAFRGPLPSVPKWRQQQAHQLVAKAIQRGELVRRPCEVCGATRRTYGHHDDYDKPLEVRWLCMRHHMVAHGKKEKPKRVRKSYTGQLYLPNRHQ